MCSSDLGVLYPIGVGEGGGVIVGLGVVVGLSVTEGVGVVEIGRASCRERV